MLLRLGSCPLTEEGARSDYGYVCGSSGRSSYTGSIGHRLSFCRDPGIVKRHQVLKWGMFGALLAIQIRKVSFGQDNKQSLGKQG